MNPSITDTLSQSFNNAIFAVSEFIPRFLAGAIILIIGILVSSILKQAVLQLFKVLKLESFLRKYGVPEVRQDFTWSNVLAEIVRWFVFIVFLIPTADVWGLPRVVTVLNEFLRYLPNVFVAAIIGLVGFVFARIAHDVVLGSTKNLSPESSTILASIVKWSINIFVLLAVLTQLGVAADLIRILFTGFVAMVAVAGGIAFGLGGQGAAKDLIDGIKKRLK